VRGLMKEQHKAMFIALRDGEFDHLFEDLLGANKSRPGVPPAPPSSVSSLVEGAPTSPTATGVETKEKEKGPVATAKTMRAPPAAGLEPGKPGPQIHAPDARGVSPTALTAAALEMPRREQSAAAQGAAAGKGDADLATMERAADAPQSAVFQQIHDLPPPPAAVLGKKRPSDVPAGSYRAVSPQPSSHVVNPPPPSDTEARAAKPASGNASGGAGRYAPTRPAAIFANARPADGASIFGEDLISEKSLDEVILSYLAEDLDSQPPKK
jgi:hypothetical protein